MAKLGRARSSPHSGDPDIHMVPVYVSVPAFDSEAILAWQLQLSHHGAGITVLIPRAPGARGACAGFGATGIFAGFPPRCAMLVLGSANQATTRAWAAT